MQKKNLAAEPGGLAEALLALKRDALAELVSLDADAPKALLNALRAEETRRRTLEEQLAMLPQPTTAKAASILCALACRRMTPLVLP